MILSRNDLYVSQSNTIILSEDTSLFSYGVECITETDNQLRTMLLDIYKDSIISEGVLDKLKNFDFIKIIKYIIKLFKDMLDKLIQRFVYLMTQLNYSDRSITKRKKEIENYDGTVEINFEHYNYTNLDANIPDPNLFLNFKEEYEITMEDLKNIGKSSDTKEEFIRKINEYNSKIELEISNGYYNKIRKQIVDSSGMNYDNNVVTVENYATKLFACFRHGVNNPITGKITLSNDMIKDSLHRFINSKDIIHKVEKQRRKIQDVCDKVVSNLEKKTAKDFLSTDGKLDYDLEYAVNNVLKTKAGQLTENCNIYILAFSAKLDAIKEAVITDKKILYKVLEFVMIDGGDNK